MGGSGNGQDITPLERFGPSRLFRSSFGCVGGCGSCQPPPGPAGSWGLPI